MTSGIAISLFSALVVAIGAYHEELADRWRNSPRRPRRPPVWPTGPSVEYVDWEGIVCAIDKDSGETTGFDDLSPEGRPMSFRPRMDGFTISREDFERRVSNLRHATPSDASAPA